MNSVRGATPIFTIAVTGTAASGKSSVCARFIELGLPVISLDAVSRDVVMPGAPALAEMVSAFGQDILGPDGGLDRPLLRRRMLADAGVRSRLESIMHPAILARMEERIQAAHDAGRAVVIVEVPLLFELGMAGRFDVVVLVRAGHGARLDRLSARDGVSREAAESLISLQMPDEEKAALSDVIIDNSGEFSETIRQVDRFWEEVVKPLDTQKSMV